MYTIDLKAIDVTTRILNLHGAVSKVVQLYVNNTRRQPFKFYVWEKKDPGRGARAD